jgi:hypothetical protein
VKLEDGPAFRAKDRVAVQIIEPIAAATALALRAKFGFGHVKFLRGGKAARLVGPRLDVNHPFELTFSSGSSRRLRKLQPSAFRVIAPDEIGEPRARLRWLS